MSRTVLFLVLLTLRVKPAFAKKPRFNFRVVNVRVEHWLTGMYIPATPATTQTTNTENVQLADTPPPFGSLGVSGTNTTTSVAATTPATPASIGYGTVPMLFV